MSIETEQPIFDPEVNLRLSLNEATYLLGLLATLPYHAVVEMIEKMSAQLTHQTGCQTAREMLETLRIEGQRAN